MKNQIIKKSLSYKLYNRDTTIIKLNINHMIVQSNKSINDDFKIVKIFQKPQENHLTTNIFRYIIQAWKGSGEKARGTDSRFTTFKKFFIISKKIA